MPLRGREAMRFVTIFFPIFKLCLPPAFCSAPLKIALHMTCSTF